LVLGPRPGKKSKAAIGAMGLSHICTLLSEREDPAAVECIARELGCDWLWLPISGGNLETLKNLDAERMITQFAQAIKNTSIPRIYLHCSAGIHRTGFVASLLLRLQPLEAGEVLKALGALRAITADQIGPDRMVLALAHADDLLEKE
jgi:protein-tyrosine phosphatase